MKTKIGVIAMVFALFTNACKKEQTDNPEGLVSTMDTLSVPAAFKQNILFEVFTATWCGWCPEKDYEVDDNLKMNPSRMFAAMIHSSDFFDADENNVLHDFFNIQGIPTLAFNYNRFGSSNYASYLTKNPKFGVAVSSKMEGADSVEVQVAVGFDETVDKNLKLMVYLVEDGITASQENFYDDDPSSILYHAGSPITNFTHNNIFRKSITSSSLGENIADAETFAGNKLIRTYHFPIDANWNKNKLKLVAFVTDGVLKTSSQGANQFFNVNGAKLGETALWF